MLVQELPINRTDRPGRYSSDLQIHPTALRGAIRPEPSGNLDIWRRAVFLRGPAEELFDHLPWGTHEVCTARHACRLESEAGLSDLLLNCKRSKRTVSCSAYLLHLDVWYSYRQVKCDAENEMAITPTACNAPSYSHPPGSFSRTKCRLLLCLIAHTTFLITFCFVSFRSVPSGLIWAGMASVPYRILRWPFKMTSATYTLSTRPFIRTGFLLPPCPLLATGLGAASFFHQWPLPHTLRAGYKIRLKVVWFAWNRDQLIIFYLWRLDRDPSRTSIAIVD